METRVMKKLAAFIIEDRVSDTFGKTVYNHMKHLPEDTDLFIYTKEECKQAFKEQLVKFKVKYKFKPYDQDAPIPTSIKYIQGLDKLLEDKRMKSLFNMCMVMTTPDFWKDYFDYERVLVFQQDSNILRKGIENFFEYDYVGAPCYNFVRDQTIQNGGFSLRNPRVMEYVCRLYGWNTDLQDMMVVGQYSSASFFAEDIFFCLRIIKHNAGKLAPLDVAKKFSVESKFELGSFGYHRIDAYLTEDEQKQIKEQYKS
jgi:hypothetical protein